MLKVYASIFLTVLAFPFIGPGGLLASSRVTTKSLDSIFVDNFPANVYGITLDRTVLRVGTSEANSLVRAWTLASDPWNDVLVYNYMVSAGQIVGAKRLRAIDQTTLVSFSAERQGSEIVWDLSGVGPGEYTITAAVDDGCPLCGRTATQTVTILATNAERPASTELCSPQVTIKSNRGFVRKNQTIQFLLVSDARYERLPRFIWSASGGEILSGQGTPIVNIRVDKNTKKSISVAASRGDSEISSPCSLEAGLTVQVRK